MAQVQRQGALQVANAARPCDGIKLTGRFIHLAAQTDSGSRAGRVPGHPARLPIP
jgi:hypothetical protein